MCVAIQTQRDRHYSIGDLRDAGWTIPDGIHDLLREVYTADHYHLNGLFDSEIDDLCFCHTLYAIRLILDANGATWREDQWGDGDILVTDGPETDDPHILHSTGGGFSQPFTTECWCGWTSQPYTTESAAVKAHRLHASTVPAATNREQP